MSFAGEQTRRRIEPDPAGAGQIHFAPRVKVGEVAFGSRRAVERFLVGRELNQIAGHEPRGQSKLTKKLHEQPRRVAARAARGRQRFVRSLHARLHPDDVPDVALQLAIQIDKKVDGPPRLDVDAGEVLPKSRGRLFDAEERLQLAQLPRVVSERESFRFRLEEEVERVVDRHLRDEIDFDAELAHRVGERHPRDVIALRILLPVDEVFLRRDRLRVRQHSRPAVRGGPQTHQLRREDDAAVVAIMRDVTQGDVNTHR